ncbi:OLC1v1031913C1 [Oldenlandia corymbosa var. corymbosa]|uniref:OLC1v1031913C1 n=1 Tax=Oldenlandia corymbosa var. corymbosa TaxID=529605 RepID=A0AAV1CL89_OLDCO|nr:OLC1v1031913C1 [Oldenlandia corymbosa var. corymbosa]
MAWNGPYFINVYWRNKYVVEDGTIRTFDNRADATLVIERKLSYSEFLGRICDKAGWDRNYVNLRINLLFENNGVRRSATITDDSSVEIIYYFSGSSYLELYVENEDTVQAQNLLDLSGQKQDVTFVSQQDQQYWMNNSQHAEAGPSRSSGDGYVAEGHGGGQNDDFDSSDEDDASDGTYVESEEEVDYQTDVSDETDLEDEEQEADAGAEAVQNLVTSDFGQHVYSDIGDYKNSILDRDEFEVKMWKGDRENLDLNTCFNNRDEVEAAIEDWNIYHNRQFYVLSSGRKSWSSECATRRMQTPIGQSTCAWRMRASLKKNGLWQIVSWVDRHNCVGITRQNDHRNLRSKLIARLIRRSVENDPGFKVKSIRDAVKEAYKVDVKYKKAWHARRKAIEACYGSWIDNFTELPWYCLRHVRSNMVAKHKKQIARTNLVCWKMGKKRQNHKFLKFQQQLRECNEAGLAYMMAIPRERWSLAYDQDYARWGMLTTNISESYNNVLKGVRFLPIRAVVESTLAKTIKFFRDQYADALKCNTPIGDKYWKKFCKYENTAATHKVELYDFQQQVYGVITGWRRIGKGGNEHKVEYRDWRCSCKKWQTYRLPCSHALAVCRWIGDHPENIIHEYYKTSTWREQFRRSRFVPVPRREEWVSPGWNLVPDYVNLVPYNAVGRQQQRRFLMSMDYTGRGARRRCRRCGSRDHLTRHCHRSHRLADRTRLEVNWDANGFENIWAYERIPRIRPIRKNPEDDDHTLALGSRWRCSLDFSQVASHCLPAQQDQLASLRKVEDFIWQPYEGVEIPERCTRGRDHWQSNTWLICWDVIEPHQVDRVMRQFGFKQFIPPQPMIVGFQEWEKLHKYGRTGRGGNNWELHHREYIEKWNNRADSIVAGSPRAQSSTDDDYLPWYESNTIKFIKDPNKYNFQEEGYREHSDRAKFYADALSDICKMVEDYKKSEDVCQNSVCTNLLLELTSHSMSALSLGAHEMPFLIPTQSLVDLQPQPSQPVGKVRKWNIPHRGIGGGRQKIVEEEEPEFDFELNADLFQTPTPHHQDEANQEGESTNMDVESSLPLALARPRRKLKKVNRYTPSTAQPEEEL